MERSQATGITVILRKLLLKYCRRKIGFKILQENTICFSDWKDTMDKKSVLITGGTSGIGLAAARMFLVVNKKAEMLLNSLEIVIPYNFCGRMLRFLRNADMLQRKQKNTGAESIVL